MKFKTLAALICVSALAERRQNAPSLSLSKAAPLLLLVGLTGCQSVSGGCAGFTKPPKPNDAVYLAENEEKLSRWIVATDKFGTSAGCWN